jgi:hypothetical protein
VKRTNPNKKWDWWVLGGRWAGFLKLRGGAEGTVRKERPLFSGLPDEMVRAEGNADAAMIRDIDVMGMREAKGAEAAADWDKLHGIIGDREVPDLDEIYARHGSVASAAREEYWSHPVMKEIRADRDLMWWSPSHLIRLSKQTRGEAESAGMRRGLSTYALVAVDGTWHQKGQMGWFGMSDDKVSQEEWDQFISDYVDGLPDDHWLAVVDCHI